MGYYKLKCGCVARVSFKDNYFLFLREIPCQNHKGWGGRIDLAVRKFHPNGAIQLRKLDVAILKLGQSNE